MNSTACKSQGPAEGAARTNNITHFLVGGLNHPLGDIHYFLTPPESQTPLGAFLEMCATGRGGDISVKNAYHGTTNGYGGFFLALTSAPTDATRYKKNFMGLREVFGVLHSRECG